jgi:hypothetical protein
MNFANELTAYGPTRLGQREFERAIVTNVHGRPAFTHLTVHPYRLTGSSAPTNVRVHVVAGLYCDGQPRDENGRQALRWEPAYFVASVPYLPVGTGKPGTAPQPPSADVLAYLRSTGVPFRYDSFWWATRPPFVWTCGGFLVIGVVWPTVVNLLVFGRWTRPAEPKGLSIFATTSPPPTSPARRADTAALLELEDEVESHLAEPATVPAQSESAPRTLTSDPLQPAEATAGPHKEFAAAREDFYPNELAARHKT